MIKLMLALTTSICLVGCGGGAGSEHESGWDWDGFLVNGSTQWRCRDIGSGQFAADTACGNLPKTDQRWPTAGVVPEPSGGWTRGVEISKVCAAQIEDYKEKIQNVQPIHSLDYNSIGEITPEIVNGLITKKFDDLRDALWVASPYVAITKPQHVAHNGTRYFSWDDYTYPDGTNTFSRYHADYWREVDTQYVAILMKKSDFHWAVWVIVNGKCGSFNMDNGNYKGRTIYP